MKQNKGRGVVLMDRTVYLDKCLDILDTNQFTKLSTDPTKKMEEKNRLFLRKIKRSLSAQEYSPYIPQCHIRVNSMGNLKFVNYQNTEMWTSYLLKQLFLILELPLTNLQKI